MESRSIHPRVENGRTAHDKVNTCRPYKSGGGKLAWKQKRLSERRNSHSSTIRLSKNELAYRAPGSMKGY